MIEPIFCDNHLLIVDKPSHLLTQPDQTGNDSLEEMCKLWVKKKYHKPKAVYLHCIHRLDRPASGLVLFARTSKCLSRLNEQSRLNEIQRIYIAEVEGSLSQKEGRLDHYLIHGDRKAILAKQTDPQAKHARLTYRILEHRPHSTLVEIELETGRYHQIRAQFSATGHAVLGDLRYGAKTGDGQTIHLHCARLIFQHPITNEVLDFKVTPPF